MANDYFNHSIKLQPGTKARAEDVNQRFDNIVTGLDKLPAPHPTLKGFNEPIVVGAATAPGHAVSVAEALGGGISYAADTGVANAYVVDLDIAPAAYVDGLTVTFKALNANTGPSTININGLGIKQLTRSNGLALVAGDIAVGQITTVIYNGTKFLGMAAFQGQFDELTGACEAFAASADADAATATTQAGIATTKAGEASTSAGTATTQAGIATTKAGDADTARIAAEAAETLAEKWASNPYNTLVDGVKYSALHYATVAANEAATSTPASLLIDIKTVDGAGSGLDADLLDGQQGSYYAPLASPTFTGTVGGITKAMVGLGNVDNTSDVNKPISTLQQTALNLKAPIESPTFTGAPTAPTPAITDNTGKIATTQHISQAFIGSAASSGYQKFKNGIVIQWGAETAHATAETEKDHSFALAFTGVYGFVACPCPVNDTSGIDLRVYTLATTGFKSKCSLATCAFRFIAVGYIAPS